MNSYYLMMDVGGTEVKAGVLNQDGVLVGESEVFTARAKESRDVIFDNFTGIIEYMKKYLPKETIFFSGIGMATPGPFDYEHGICLMRGVDKYDGIYGCDIKEEIIRRIKRKAFLKSDWEYSFVFLHDVEAFAIGEGKFGPASASQKVFCLCIGTGTGSAFVEQGKVVKGGPGIPNQGWIYDTPFLEGRIDDYLSVRGLRKLTEEEFSSILEGVELYRLARDGNIRARRVFQKFGTHILLAIQPFLQEFAPDAVILGGGIAKSYPYFGEPLDAYCKKEGISIYCTENTSKRVWEGLYTKFQMK